MQHKAMQLMSRKMAAAQALEGQFSEEGLAAMAGEDNLQLALAKKLSERISESDIQHNWGKVKSNSGKKRTSSKLDTLTEDQEAEVNAGTAAQMIAETMEELRLAEYKCTHAAALPAEDEWENAGPEKELDDETGEEFEMEL